MPSTNENIKAAQKMILDNRRITIGEIADEVGIGSVYAKNFYGCFRHVKCGNEDFSKSTSLYIDTVIP